MMATKPPRAWQRMLSGRRLDLLDPSPLDVEIEAQREKFSAEEGKLVFGEDVLSKILAAVDKGVVDAYVTPAAAGDTVMDITSRASDFLALAGVASDDLAPMEISTQALALFKATFNRPEESAPADPAAPSTGAN